jgi:hypothetical protein
LAVSDGDNRIDKHVEFSRRWRSRLAVAAIISIPVAYAVVRWRLDNPSDAHTIVAMYAVATPVFLALYSASAFYTSDRERYIRWLKFVRRHSVPHHDPSPTRVCPRCGLPMDRLAGGDFYTGPPSPRELCHRCLHTDRWLGPDIPE